MINVKYELYRNDYLRKYKNKSFPNMEAFKDWMFGMMNQPYRSKAYGSDADTINMFFLDGVVSGKFPLSSSSRIEINPVRTDPHCWIYCVSDNNKIVFSNGKYTNGQCYISEGFKDFLGDCLDKRDAKVQSFEFGEISGYRPAVNKLMTYKKGCVL